MQDKQKYKETIQSYFHQKSIPPFIDEVLDYLCRVMDLEDEVRGGQFFDASLETLGQRYDEFYRPMLPAHYESGFLFPPFAKRKLGEKTGAALSALYADLMAAIPFAIRGETEKLSLLLELFADCAKAYAAAADSDEEQAKAVQEQMGAFYRTQAAAFVPDSIRQMIVASPFARLDSEPVAGQTTEPPEQKAYLRDASDVIAQIIHETTGWSDIRYLYRYGSYVGQNEIQMARFLCTLPENEIHRIAETFVGGYIKGFEAAGKDITKKKTVKIEYPIGMERMIREAVRLFAEEGLAATFVAEPVLSVTGRGESKRGIYNISANRRFDFDHKDDAALYLSEALNEARLSAIETTFMQFQKEASVHGGPAVIEVFGEALFSPTPETANMTYTAEQNRQNIAYASGRANLTNRFIPGEERSYTIISFPIPEIGKQFEEIFEETMKINTLDYTLYQTIQQRIIDALDQGVAVRVRGAGSNETDMLVQLHALDDPSKQTNFENCVADVNIPVGEVFTSPVLEGTCGTLFVSHAFLSEYEYHNLKLVFEDGMVKDYSCELPNQADAPESQKAARRLIEDHIFHHHPTLPIGEFAIGTNTTAYRMARDFGLEAKLPILIMEKTGPHFAVGDTCYSFEEDAPIFNPDGKECIARENSRSILRKSKDKTERESAYYHCHTDITIPFEELDSIVAITGEGKEIDIIRGGRFVLPGTEALNKPL